MEPDWKKNAEMCGLVLDNNTVRALNESGISDCSNMSTIHLKHQIYSALPTTSASTYDGRKSMAFNLAVVAKYGSPTFPSWLICFGITPFKLQCRLPDRGVLSTSEVKQYCPNIPDIAYTGEFVHYILHGLRESIYIYSFQETVGCSEIGRFHYALPQPKVSSAPITHTELAESQSICAGNAYIHLNKDAITSKYTTSGNIEMTFNPQTSTGDGNEDRRTECLRDHLRDVLPAQYEEIEVSLVEKIQKKRMANYCHFTGGGDLRVSRTGFEFLLMTTEDTESGGMSPIDQGEVRETLDIECKQSASKTNVEIRYQLMANMYNLLVRQFTSKLSKARTTQQLSHVLQLSKISLYGMSIGIYRPVEILKLKVDFGRSTLDWEVKFENCSSLPKELLIDSCIIAVIKRLSKKSPSPPIA